MFDDVGYKIKGLAKVSCWIGIICSIIVGIGMGISLGNMVLGIGIMIVGSLFSWIGSFTLYGFGELIENSQKEEHVSVQVAPMTDTQLTNRMDSKDKPAVSSPAAPVKKLPVLASNKCDSFYPHSIDLVPVQDKLTIVLHVFKLSKEPVQAIKASITFKNLFGDETPFENICFVCENENGIRWSSHPCQIVLPEDSMLLSSCNARIQAYIQNEEVVTVSDALLRPLDELKPAKDSSVMIEALFQNLSQLKGSREMMDYLQTNDSGLSTDLLSGMMTALQNRYAFERLYGSNCAETLKAVRKAIDQYLSE